MSEQEIIDPFYRELYKRLNEMIQDRMYSLATGSAFCIPEDAKTVAEKYAEQTATITAYVQVLDLCKDIEKDRYQLQKMSDSN